MARVVQIDIPVADLDVAKAFYQEIFSLQASPAELYGRVILEVDRDSQVGLSLVLTEEIPSSDHTQKDTSFSIYLQVENIDAVLAKCQALGTSFSEKQKNPPYGWLAKLEDPFKNIIHICQP